MHDPPVCGETDCQLAQEPADEPHKAGSMTVQALLIVTLAATDILIGVQSLGVFWPVLVLVALWRLTSKKFQLSTEAKKLRRSLLMVMFAMAVSSLASATTKPTSLVYAAMFLVYGFWLLTSLGTFREIDTAKAMKSIVIAYFASSLAATLAIAIGISGFETFILTRSWTNLNTGETRPLGFSSEPSYAAFIVVLAWLTLVRLGQIRPRARNGFSLWTGLTLISLQLFGSIYGYLLAIVVVVTSISLLPRRARRRWLIAAAVLGVIVVAYVASGDNGSRSLRIFRAVFSGDLEIWLSEDTSSFFRFGPTFSYILSANFSDVGTWLGHGAASSGYFFTDLFRMHVDADKDAVELGFFPAFIYDYGMLAGALFLRFLHGATRGPQHLAIATTLFMLIFNANFGTQMMWFAITCAVLSRQSIESTFTRPL